jgi:hypothetical protein
MKENTAMLARRGGAMRLTLSADVASDLGALKASLKSLAERAGHPACATGCDILHLEMEREFLARRVGDKVELSPQPLPPGAAVGLPQDPVPVRPITVSMPATAFNDINQLSSAIERVVLKLGCSPCCSGFDILFQQEQDMLALNGKLEVQGFGRFA